MKPIHAGEIPRISVIMGIHNCEKTLREAVDSICRQTYTNWELILWDDGSTDGTYKIAQEYAAEYPDRIRAFHDRENRKLAHALNECLCRAEGELIARKMMFPGRNGWKSRCVTCRNIRRRTWWERR